MGSTEFLVCMSEQPQHMEKLHTAFLLAPPAWFTAMTGPLLNISQYVDPLERFFERIGYWEALPDNNMTSIYGHTHCDDEHFEDNKDDCLKYADMFFMVSRDQLNETMLPIYFDVYPEGSSVKPLVHYGQLIENGENFTKYDFGRVENMEIYGTSKPPNYDMSQITMPLYLYYGDGDSLVDPIDVQILADHLPNVQIVKRVPYDGWTHNDMVYAMDAPTLLYQDIIDEMEAIFNDYSSGGNGGSGSGSPNSTNALQSNVISLFFICLFSFFYF